MGALDNNKAQTSGEADKASTPLNHTNTGTSGESGESVKPRNDEEAKTEKKTRKTAFFGVPLIVPYIRQYGKRIAFMIFLGVLSSLADTIYPLFSQYAIDHFVADKTLEGLGTFTLLYLAVMIPAELDNYYCLYSCGWVEMHIDRDLRNTAFTHLQTLSFDYFNRNSVGYIHSRVMSDTGKIGELAAWRLMDIVWNLSYIVLVIVTMLMIRWQLALCVLAVVPPAAVLALVLQRRLADRNRNIREINGKITGNFNEGITGLRSIRTLGIEERMDEDFRKDTASMRTESVKAAHYSALMTSLVTMASSVALALILWQGGLITRQGVIEIGTLSVFMTYAVGLLEPVQALVETISLLTGIQVNIERFTDLVTQKPLVQDSPEVISRYGDTFHPKKENWEPLRGDVEFQDVSFHYPDGTEEVLSRFNLTIKAGTHVAIVGETGAGKSTLVNLVCRFYDPTGGRVLIDGKDVRLRSQLWLHSHLGYVLQTPFLFSGTVRDNLRYGREDATDEEIWKALQLAGADGVVRKMKNGLDSDVGEDGSMLSVGEKQLLSIARAILADPRILILDEATSSVDTLTEKAIQDAVDAVISGRTTFMIAHRLSTVVGADIIIAVKDGKIAEMGSHSELMQKKGYYYDLYTRQFTQSGWEDQE